MNYNKISMEKRQSIIINTGTNEVSSNDVYIGTFLKNLSCFGYTLSLDAIEVLKTLSKDEIFNLHNELLPIIKEIKGNKASIEPLYKNFPAEVMEKSECEIFFDALIYALTNFILTPQDEKKERFPLLDNSPLEIINLITMDEYMKIFTNLVGSKSSLPAHDMTLISEYVSTFGEDILKYLPEKIYFKEILAHVTSLCMSFKGAEQYFSKLYTNGTDVLRLAVALSDGDVSLSLKTPFITFKRPVRRFLLSLLENTRDIEEHMKKRKTYWISLGEKLHPGEYKQFPKTKEAFKKLRNNGKLESFYSKLEAAFLYQDEATVIKLLSSRPGEFARNLDFCLRSFHTDNILTHFDMVADKIASPILLQLREFYVKRNIDRDVRAFFPKGSMAKCYAIENTLPKIDEDVASKVVEICSNALVKVYSEKEAMGKVFIDERLKSYLVPNQLRNASRAIKTLARGSRVAIGEDTSIIRLFLYWHENQDQDNVDLDLSVGLLDENFELKESICYYNVKDEEYNCYHSGDVREASNGASEFIDVDIKTLKEKGIRYVTTSIYSYTQEKFVDLKECFMGYMERVEPKSGEIFEPSTVKNKVDVLAEGTNTIPFILDIETMEIVWTDMAGDITRFCNNETNKNRLINTTKAILNCVKPNLYDLAFLNATARGEVVDNKDEADIIFSLDEGVTPFNTDIILAEYI